MDLIDEAIELRREGNGSLFGFSIFGDMMGNGNSSMAPEELEEVLQREKEDAQIPVHSMSSDFFNDFDDDLEDNQCRHCDAENCPTDKPPTGRGIYMMMTAMTRTMSLTTSLILIPFWIIFYPICRRD